MKLLALFLALCLGTAGFAHAGELSDAAKDAKTKRRKSTSKVITNADVKKSKGKVGTTNVTATPVEREPTLMEKQEAARASQKIADELGAQRQKLVAELEKELAALEQSYYDENDLNRRDTVIVPRFNDVKAKLDAARAELAQLP